jgi:hypothetical protein
MSKQRSASTGVADAGELDGIRAFSVAAPNLSAWVLATWGGIAMVVLLPALVVYLTPGPQNSAWSLALVATTVSGARWTWIVAEGRRRVFEISFWVFAYVFVGVAPLVQLRSGKMPSTTPGIDTSLQTAAMLVVIVGLFAFLFGLSIPFDRRMAMRNPFVINGVNLTRTIVLALVALCFDLYVVAKVGFGALFATRDELSQAYDANWPESSTEILVQAGVCMTLLVAFIALVKAIRQTGSREWPLIGLCVVVGLALAVTINPITAPRYIFGSAALAVAALFGLFGTPGRFRGTAIFWVVALIVVFPLADAFRYSAQGDLKFGSLTDTLSSDDFDAFAQINNTLLYVERHGITDGRQAAGVALFWVPRRVWADKPRDTGILLAESRGYKFQNLSAPMWAEMYINGGWPLLVLGMMGFGILVGAQDKKIDGILRRARAPGILACILPFYLMILLRGSLLQAMSYLTVILVSTAFVSRWEKVRPQ